MLSKIFPDTPLNRRLMNAFDANDLAGATAALAAGADPNLFVKDTFVLLAMAVAADKVDFVEALLDAMILIRNNDAPRAAQWMNRFPSLGGAQAILNAIGVAGTDSTETFELLVQAGSALPETEWEKLRDDVAAKIERLAGIPGSGRMKALFRLDKGLHGHPGLTRALMRAARTGDVEQARWLIENGADPHTPSSPSNDYTGKRTAHEEAIRCNRPELLDLWEGDFDEKTWRNDCALAVAEQSRTVFEKLWKTANLPDARKRELLLGTTVHPRHRIDAGRGGMSLIEAACRGRAQARRPVWVSRLLSLGLGTKEQMGQALHAFFEIPSRATAPHKADKDAVQILDAAGAEWAQPNQRGITARRAGLANHAWKATVEDLVAAAEERALDRDIPTNTKPGQRRRL